MAKNILQDVIPPEKKSIRRVTITKKSKPQNYGGSVSGASESDGSVSQPSRKKASPSKKSGSGVKIWIFAFLCVIAGGISVMSFLAEAEVKIVPKTSIADVSVELTAANASGEQGLAFNNVKYELSVEKKVPATGKQKTETKASGKIIVYNTSSTSQKLIKNTRFENGGGLIYRLKEPITVPASKTVGGKKAAGSVEASVIADAVGDKYNIGLSDFTLPAFKGDPKYSIVYARSKTEMTGGFTGMKNVISNANIKAAKNEIETELKTKLIQGVMAQKPSNHAFFESGSVISFGNLTEKDEGDFIILGEKGVIKALLFDKNELSEQIAKSAISTTTQNIVIENLDKMNFKLKNNIIDEDAESVTFSITGKPKFIWQFDSEKLKNDIAGKSKSYLGAALSTYGEAIYKAEATISPFWKFSFPNDPKKIKLKIVNSI